MNGATTATRKQIRDALYDLLAQATEFKTIGKRIEIPQNVESYDMPALFIVKPEESINEEIYGLSKIGLEMHVVIYLMQDATPPDTTIEDVIDDLLDTILGQPGSHVTGLINIVNPDGSPKLPGEPQTLGGLVTDVRVNGKVMIDSGVLGRLCAIEIPFTVLNGI